MKNLLLTVTAGVFMFLSFAFMPGETAYVEGTAISKQFLDSSFNAAIAKGFFPGAQLVIGNRDGILYEKTYGYHDYSKKEVVKKEDVYDMASCSKVLGTTVGVMKLVGEGKISLQDRLGELLPQFAETPIRDLTLLELMTHTTGMVAFVPFYQQLVETTDGSPMFSKDSSANYPLRFGDVFVYKGMKYNDRYISTEPREGYVLIADNLYLNPEYYPEMDKQICKSQTRPRGKYLYSDLNLILTQRMLEKVAGTTLDKYTADIYRQMGLKHIGYKPLEWTVLGNTIPTEEDNLFRRRTIQGYAHDEGAAILGNVAGHAGLFSNAEDAGSICRMLLNKGMWNGKQILKPEVIAEFMSMPLKDKEVYRGIGFDKRKPGNGVYDESSSGHTGFTGTFFWLDTEKDIYVVILTNRVHPTRNNNLLSSDDFRSKIWKYVVDRNGRHP